MFLTAIAANPKQRAQADLRGPHESSPILQDVFWYLRYPLSYRHIEG